MTLQIVRDWVLKFNADGPAGLIDRKGAILVARIDYLYLGPNSGATGGRDASQDTIIGSLRIKTPREGIVAEIPIRAITSYYPTPVDQPLPVESMARAALWCA